MKTTLAFERLAWLGCILLVVAFTLHRRSPAPAVDRRSTERLDEFQATKPHFPIRLDTETGEYQLTYTWTNGDGELVTSKFVLTYCPWTGAKLPESRRGTVGSQSFEVEESRLSDFLKDARTLKDVERLLGKPDEVQGPEDGVLTWTYTKKAKTLSVVVQVNNAGKLEISFWGKSRVETNDVNQVK